MDNKQLAIIFKALSNPNRLEIFREIVKHQEKNYETGEYCVLTDIVKCMKIGAPTISHHLKELTNAGLIVTERKGKFITARINKEAIGQIDKILTK